MAQNADTKYQQSVAKGTGNGAATTNTDAPSVPVPLVRKMNQAELDAMLAEGGYEYAPQAKSLEEGDRISGILEGNGPEQEFTDAATGEVKVVQTWIISSPDGGQRISILSSAQLDRKMPPYIGSMVDVVRGKDLKTSNGHRCTDYLVRGPKLANGARRSFVQPPKMIDASSEHKALPAPVPSAATEGASAATPTAS